MLRVRCAVPVAAVALMLAGCGGGTPAAAPAETSSAGAATTSASPMSSPPTTSSPATAGDDDQAALAAAVRSYSSAFLSGKGQTAYALLSKRCRERVTAAEFGAIAEQARSTYGDLPITSLTVDALAGGMARVTYSYAVPALKQTGEPWVLEGESWHQDDC